MVQSCISDEMFDVCVHIRMVSRDCVDEAFSIVSIAPALGKVLPVTSAPRRPVMDAGYKRADLLSWVKHESGMRFRHLLDEDW